MKSASDREKEALRNSGLFDAEWYLQQYPDVAKLGMEPLEHYMWIGSRLRRNPSPRFCTASYLEANPDVAKASIDALVHYVQAGRHENRPTYPVLSDYEKNARAKCKRIIGRRTIEWPKMKELDFLARMEKIDLNNKETFVSIIMPTKDRDAFIGNAIDSVLRQSHECFELIIIDDGSRDNTNNVVQSFADHRIRFIQYEESAGVSIARNRGLKQAKADWIFFLDSDNTWRPNLLDCMLKFVTHQQLSAAYCAVNLIGDDGASKSVLYSDFDYESCLQENFIDLNGFCVKKNLAEIGFDEQIKRLVDWDFILRIGAHTRIRGAEFVGVDYYDGSQHGRITNNEYRKNSEISKLVSEVRAKAKRYFREAPTHWDLSSYRIAVVLHVFYADLVEECLSYLDNIDFEFDLFVTTPLEIENNAFHLIRARYPDAIILRYPNIGSDIGPFLELIPTLKSYFLVCKLHTKRDVGKWGSLWRTNLLRAILNSQADVNNMVARFVSNSELVVAGSKEFYKLGVKNSIPETLRQVHDIASAIGLTDYLEEKWGFFAGTMFWARPDLFLGLGEYMCEAEGYSVKFRQDGGLEHGLERMMGIVPWGQAHAMVGLVDPLVNGTVTFEELGIGSGHSVDGVSVSLNRLANNSPSEEVAGSI